MTSWASSWKRSSCSIALVVWQRLSTRQRRPLRNLFPFGGHRFWPCFCLCQALNLFHWHRVFGVQNPPSSTSFLLVNAPGMRQALRKWQITRELPKGISIGRDQAGGWSTSVLKEYPPSLNGGLAEGILAAIGQCASDPSVTVPISFADRCASMMCAEYGEHIGPDYAG